MPPPLTTGTFSDDLARMRALSASIAASVQAENLDTCFGVSSFVDIPCCGFGSSSSNDYSYQTHMKLSPNAALVTCLSVWSWVVCLLLLTLFPLYPVSHSQMQSTLNGLSTRNGVDLPESQLVALLHVARRAEEVRVPMCGVIAVLHC